MFSSRVVVVRRLRQRYIFMTGFVAAALIMLIGISTNIVYGQESGTMSKMTENTTSNRMNTKTLEIGNASYPVRYQISGDNQLAEVWVQRDNITLAAEISTVSDGVLNIELPRDFMDSKKQSNADDAYAVFVDGQFVTYDEIMNNTQARTLRIEFSNGSELIEITGTHVVPEFGSLAALVLAISIASMVLITKIKKQR